MLSTKIEGIGVRVKFQDSMLSAWLLMRVGAQYYLSGNLSSSSKYTKAKIAKTITGATYNT
jgi:hypothetical protein